jgi:hypothetical protein
VRDALAAVLELYVEQGRPLPAGMTLPAAGEVVWKEKTDSQTAGYRHGSQDARFSVLWSFSVRQAKFVRSRKVKGACHVNCPFDM